MAREPSYSMLFDKAQAGQQQDQQDTRQQTTYQGVNPWKKETFNLTEQGQIYKRDPALAERLAKEAGKKLSGSETSEAWDGQTNPWAPGHKNLTHQGEAYRQNPQKAREMAAQYGYDLQ